MQGDCLGRGSWDMVRWALCCLCGVSPGWTDARCPGLTAAAMISFLLHVSLSLCSAL